MEDEIDTTQFFLGISDELASDLVLASGKDGSFLLRTVGDRPNQLTLSVCHQGSVQHVLLRIKDGLACLENPPFHLKSSHTVSSLLSSLQEESVLSTRLCHQILPGKPSPVPLTQGRNTTPVPITVPLKIISTPEAAPSRSSHCKNTDGTVPLDLSSCGGCYQDSGVKGGSVESMSCSNNSMTSGQLDVISSGPSTESPHSDCLVPLSSQVDCSSDSSNDDALIRGHEMGSADSLLHMKNHRGTATKLSCIYSYITLGSSPRMLLNNRISGTNVTAAKSETALTNRQCRASIHRITSLSNQQLNTPSQALNCMQKLCRKAGWMKYSTCSSTSVDGAIPEGTLIMNPGELAVQNRGQQRLEHLEEQIQTRLAALFNSSKASIRFNNLNTVSRAVLRRKEAIISLTEEVSKGYPSIRHGFLTRTIDYIETLLDHDMANMENRPESLPCHLDTFLYQEFKKLQPLLADVFYQSRFLSSVLSPEKEQQQDEGMTSESTSSKRPPWTMRGSCSTVSSLLTMVIETTKQLQNLRTISNHLHFTQLAPQADLSLIHPDTRSFGVQISGQDLLLLTNPGVGCVLIANSKNLQKGLVLVFQEDVPAVERSLINNLELVLLLRSDPCIKVMFKNRMERELACLTMSRAMPQPEDSRQLNLFVGTWNLDSFEPPPGGLGPWLTCRGQGQLGSSPTLQCDYHIIVVGTQRNIVKSKEWTNQLRATLAECSQSQYTEVISTSQAQTRISVFVKFGMEAHITDITSSKAAHGRRTSVAVSFSLGGRSFCFINSHFPSSLHKKDQSLGIKEMCASTAQQLQLGQRTPFGVESSFSYLFWFGNLNTSLELKPQIIVEKLGVSPLTNLLSEDPLLKNNSFAFCDFFEDSILFPPTSRYELGTRDRYILRKVKGSSVFTKPPSWRDRILWKHYPGMPIYPKSYGSCMEITTSHHSPLFGTFEVPLSVLSTTSLKSKLEPHTIAVGVLCLVAKLALPLPNYCNESHGAESFVVEFHSSLWSGPIKSGESKPVSSSNSTCVQLMQLKDLTPLDVDNSVVVRWTGFAATSQSEIAMKTLMDPTRHHVWLVVRCVHLPESVGCSVFSAASVICQEPRCFHFHLIKDCILVGDIRGYISVNVMDSDDLEDVPVDDQEV